MLCKCISPLAENVLENVFFQWFLEANFTVDASIITVNGKQR